MNPIEWPDQWYEVRPEQRASLEKELFNEINPDHILFGRSVRAIARDGASDDVLFAIDGSSEVAMVHLVYGSKELRSDWPWTVFYESLSEWQKEQTEA